MPILVANTKHFGEQQLLALLKLNEDPLLHIWCGLDYLPGVRDIDFLLWHEAAGIFLVEVKAISIDDVLEYGYNYCRIRGRDHDLGPAMQAHDAKDTLIRDYLRERVGKIFIVPTACWPKIYRSDWNARWDNPAVTGEYALRMLFREDLEAGALVLQERLKYIWQNPPIRSGERKNQPNAPRTVPPFSHNAPRLRELVDLLAPRAQPRVCISDRDRLRQLEAGVTKRVLQRFPAGARERAIFTGPPGTGKTFRLLQVGVHHAYAGKKVLFSCFNKTLGADIRRLLRMSERLRLCDYEPEVLDVFQLARRCFIANGMSYFSGKDEDAWGRMVVDELSTTASPAIEHYDTLLIDEAQDMSDWHLKLIEMHAKDGATILVARGDGQELYKQDTGSEPWLKQFSAQGTKSERLTRNFRNTKINFLAAQCQFSYYPGGIDQLPELVGKLIASSKIGAQRDLGFDRDGGELTDLIPVPDDGIDYDAGHGQEQIMVERYRQLIGDEIEQLTKDDNASLFDLLVLVPHESSARAGWLRLAMARLATECGCDYVDLTREENRRASPTFNTIRCPDRYRTSQTMSVEIEMHSN